MADTKISPERAMELLKYSENKARLMAPKKEWPSDAEMLDLARAYKKQDKLILLKAGQFTITYRDDLHRILLRPVTGLVPCGWFEYDKLDEILKVGVH